MRGAISLGSLSGIKIYVHWTFSLLLLYVSSRGYADGGNAWQIAIGIAFILTIFACVTLHEFGHALAARYYGINTRDIILLPIGGVARLEGMPQNPLHEIVVAIAGPLVNVLIAFVLQMVMYVIDGVWFWQLPPDSLFNSFWIAVLYTNLMLVLFNAIPAFPMDGGRVLRASLALLVSRPLATRIAVGIGQVAAICFGLYGIYSGQYMLIITGIFIFMSARNELAMVQRGADVPPHETPYLLEDSSDIVAIKVMPQQSAEARRLIENLQLLDHQFAVGRAIADSGIILQDNGEYFTGVGNIYTVFDNFDAAETYCMQQISHNPSLKCWLENGGDEIVIYQKNKDLG
jgi:Zn-dependent protease